MDIGFAEDIDIIRLKEIWKLCFKDEDEYIDFFYKELFRSEETLLASVDGEICSMITMLPVGIVKTDGTKHKCAMLYAIATHPDYQNRGIARTLMEFASEYLDSMGVENMILLPANESLYGFYEKQGYQKEFFNAEIEFYGEELLNVSANLELKSKEEGFNYLLFNAAEPSDYNAIRRKILEKIEYIDYTDREIAYQKKLSRFSGLDIYGVEYKGENGCFTLERIDSDTIMIKEFLISEDYSLDLLKSIANTFPCKKYILRAPANCVGAFARSKIKAFGVLRANGQSLKKEKTFDSNQSYAYLGFAFD